MTISPERGWHADDALLAAYVAGRTRPPVTASVEMHLLGCATCRAGIAALVDADPLRGVWDRVVDEVQSPQPGPVERVAAHVGLSGRDALLVAAAPAVRGAWLLGLLVCLLFSILAATQGAPQGSTLFLVVAPLVPVAAVAFAYGQDVDPLWETTLAAPYSPLRLVLLRSVSVVAVALPLALVAAPVLPGPPWVAGAWLLPAAACCALTLALSTWVDVGRAALGVGGVWASAVVAVAGPLGRAVQVLDAPVLPAYLILAVAASAVFWLRCDRLSLLGRTS
ncbi:hypothetical protein EKO23_19780 [Nocardioides guangzhouensis]|uniref:Zf-HC2 domain-containing protein n=1 Tax=Nocardioides guangzhouensis TaxID=2497878 RepID=A0A4Q4Z849_9ACTN|nr:hypothetical protein [Nocardioides guangzhouensis]RYP83174.1 hypothetical protein EKO23_19780 [Nocardioides guangzhouensis]